MVCDFFKCITVTAVSIFFTSVAVCGFLPDPVNGMVTISGPTFGSIATYTCNTGYILIGDTERVCQGNGVWSGSEPVCQS